MFAPGSFSARRHRYLPFLVRPDPSSDSPPGGLKTKSLHPGLFRCKHAEDNRCISPLTTNAFGVQRLSAGRSSCACAVRRKHQLRCCVLQGVRAPCLCDSQDRWLRAKAPVEKLDSDVLFVNSWRIIRFTGGLGEEYAFRR